MTKKERCHNLYHIRTEFLLGFLNTDLADIKEEMDRIDSVSREFTDERCFLINMERELRKSVDMIQQVWRCYDAETKTSNEDMG